MLIQDIIDKITKLLALATSPNEHEAAQATAKAQELLMQHNLSLSAIENDFASSEPLIERTEIDIMGKKIPWKGFLALALAQTNFCEMYWHRSRGGATLIMILGKSHNVAITKSIYEYLCSTVERLAASGVKAEKRNYREYLAQIAGTGIQAYSQPNWRTWKSSFILGCSRRLCDRLKAQKRAYQSNGIPAEPGQGNFVCALACRQAYEREATAIDQWKIENNIRTRSRKCRLKTQVTGDGYMAGQRAGDEIGLNRQVKSGEGQMSSLKKTTA